MRAVLRHLGLAAVFASGTLLPGLVFGQGVASQPGLRVAMPAEGRQYWIGVAVEGIPATMGNLLKLKPGQGLLVLEVAPRSPAAAAGLKQGDLLVSVNHHPLTDQDQLIAACRPVSDAAPGTVELTYIRSGDEHEVSVVPGPRPDGMRVAELGDVPAEGNRIHVGNRNLMIGPGVLFRMDGPHSMENVHVWQPVIAGKSITITQRTDAAGQRRLTITMDQNVYDVRPETVDQLPETLQPLAKQILASQQKEGADATTKPDRAAVEKRIEELQREIEELKKEMPAATEP